MDDGTWGVHLNSNADVLDAAIGALRLGVLPTVLRSAANDAAARPQACRLAASITMRALFAFG